MRVSVRCSGRSVFGEQFPEQGHKYILPLVILRSLLKCPLRFAGFCCQFTAASKSYREAMEKNISGLISKE